jgi:hypothetical protein
MAHKDRKVKKEIKVTRVMWDRREFREIQDRKGQPELMVLMVSMVLKDRKDPLERMALTAHKGPREKKATRVTQARKDQPEPMALTERRDHKVKKGIPGIRLPTSLPILRKITLPALFRIRMKQAQYKRQTRLPLNRPIIFR